MRKRLGLTWPQTIWFYFARTFNRLPYAFRAAFITTGLLFGSMAGQRGVYTITNKVFANPEGMFLPSVRKELADQTAVAATDLGVVGLKWIRVRVIIKSGMANTNTAIFLVRVGTGATVVAPELTLTSPTITFVTGDSRLLWDGIGWSNAGFQSFKIDVTNSGGAAVFDVQVDAA